MGKDLKITKEYYAQAVDSNKVVRYQAAGPDKATLEKWFNEHAQKGTFAGLEPHLRHRYLINGKPFHVEQKYILWILIIALAAFNIWMVSHGG